MLHEIMKQVTDNMVNGISVAGVRGSAYNSLIKKPSDINEGFCGNWAEEVYSRAYNVGIEVHIMHDSDYCDIDYSHTFIYYDGMYYDSETLNGTDDWTLLPIYDRYPTILR